MGGGSRALALLLVGLAAGCGGGSATQGLSPSATPSGHFIECEEHICKTHTADVDGDGRPDHITIQVPRSAISQVYFHGTYGVHIDFAKGKSIATPERANSWPQYSSHGGDLWIGATQLDHVPGMELVLGNQQGPAFTGYRVLTWRSGRLVWLPAPVQAWFAHSASSGYQAYVCTATGVAFHAATPINAAHDRFHEVDRSFVYRAGAWHQTSHRSYRADKQHLGDVKAWDNCDGLPHGI